MVKKKFLMYIILLAIIVSVPIADAAASQAPIITIDPVGNHTIGDVFFINGTTNLPASEILILDVIPEYMNWGTKNAGGNGPDFGTNSSIIANSSGINLWSVNVTDAVKSQLNSSRSPYYIYVFPQNSSIINVVATQDFNLLPAKNATPAVQFQTNPTTQPIPATTQSSPLPIALPIAVFAAIAIMRSFKNKKGM